MLNLLYILLIISQIIFSLVSYIPQIIKLLKTKKSEDISISTWVLLTLSFLDYEFILQFTKASWALVILNIFELSLCLITTILIIMYKKAPKEELK